MARVLTDITLPMQWQQSQPAVEGTTRVSRRLELAQPGYEVIINRATAKSFADHKDINWSYKTQANSEYS